VPSLDSVSLEIPCILWRIFPMQKTSDILQPLGRIGVSFPAPFTSFDRGLRRLSPVCHRNPSGPAARPLSSDLKRKNELIVSSKSPFPSGPGWVGRRGVIDFIPTCAVNHPQNYFRRWPLRTGFDTSTEKTGKAAASRFLSNSPFSWPAPTDLALLVSASDGQIGIAVQVDEATILRITLLFFRGPTPQTRFKKPIVDSR